MVSDMTMKYVRDRYGVPVRRGGRVIYTGEKHPLFGTIRSASGGRVNIELDHIRGAMPFHPTWELQYLAPGTDESKLREANGIR